MSLTPVDIAATVAAVALAASRLIKAVQPFWQKLPRPLTVLAPLVVLALPQVAAAAGLVETGQDLVSLGITAVALLAPGIAEAVEA